MIVQIYKLYDPREKSKIRYIGRTTKPNLQVRLIEHLAKAKYRYGRDTHILNWLSSLLDVGVIPIIEKIDEIEGWEESHKLERKYISSFLEEGHPLVNHEDRGIGGRNHIVSAETRKSISETLSNSLTGQTLYNSRTVYVFDRYNRLIDKHNSGSNCARYYDIPIAKISQICSGKQPAKSYNDLTFSYSKEPINPFRLLVLWNIETDKVELFTTATSIMKDLGLSTDYLTRILNNNKLTLGKYKIYDNKGKPDALIKFRELLEKTEMFNQKPSSLEIVEKVQRLGKVTFRPIGTGEIPTSAKLFFDLG